jgi:Arc/MetJ-type ribon-helix-helix transcriptional regulator
MTTSPARPRLKRRIKTASGYRISPDLEDAMNALVESGEFANRADILSVALHFWFDYRKFDVREAVREFLLSDEGRTLVRQMGRKRSLK